MNFLPPACGQNMAEPRRTVAGGRPIDYAFTMTAAALLSAASLALAAAAIAVYAFGLWRRWRPKDGKPAWAAEPQRFREPWTAAAFGLVMMAVLAQAASRLL
jgi:hypothetical protein